MKRRFGDGPVSRLLSALFDLVMINLLLIVCSLPLFTAGAAACGAFASKPTSAARSSPTACARRSKTPPGNISPKEPNAAASFSRSSTTRRRSRRFADR